MEVPFSAPPSRPTSAPPCCGLWSSGEPNPSKSAAKGESASAAHLTGHLGFCQQLDNPQKKTPCQKTTTFYKLFCGYCLCDWRIAPRRLHLLRPSLGVNACFSPCGIHPETSNSCSSASLTRMHEDGSGQVQFSHLLTRVTTEMPRSL